MHFKLNVIIFWITSINLIYLLQFVTCAISNDVDIRSVQEVKFEPLRLRFIKEESHVVVLLTVVSKTELSNVTLISNDPDVALIMEGLGPLKRGCSIRSKLTKSGGDLMNVTGLGFVDDPSCFYAEYDVVGKLPGRTSLYAVTTNAVGHQSLLVRSGQSPDKQVYPVSVIRGMRTVDAALKWSLLACLGIVTFLLSFRVEWDEIKSAFKQPIAPAIAMCCHFALNPLLAYGLGRTVHLDLTYRLSIFGLSCSPPSGLSYVWAYLLCADATMSLMTAITANIFAFGFMSAWMYTMGRTVTNNNPRVPFADLGACVAVIAGACILGYIARVSSSAFRFYTMKIATASCLLLVATDLACRIFSQLNSFVLFADWYLVASAVFVPYLGAFIAAIMTWVCRQSWPRVKYVYIQLLLQNPCIAVAMFYLCGPNSPEADISALYTNLSSTLACVPLWFGLVVHFARRGCLKEGEVDLKAGRSSVAVNIAPPMTHPTLKPPDIKVIKHCENLPRGVVELKLADLSTLSNVLVKS